MLSYINLTALFIQHKMEVAMASFDTLGPFGLTVNPGQGLSGMIDLSGFVFRSPYITEDNFPVVAHPLQTCNAYLFNFNQPLTPEEIVALMKQNDCLPATIAHIVHFGGKHYDPKSRLIVVALGSPWFNPEDSRAPWYPCLPGTKRLTLTLACSFSPWGRYYHFLGIQI